MVVGGREAGRGKNFLYEKVVTAKPGVGDITTFTGDPQFI